MTDAELLTLRQKRGKASRGKGKRNEYLLRDYLRELGWTADRVPSSGASQGFKGDIVASKDGQKVIFELKARAESFKKIYELLDQYNGLLRIARQDHTCTVSYTLEDTRPMSAFFLEQELFTEFPRFKRTFGKLWGLEKLLGEAQILVLKDDRRPFIFVAYR